METIKYTALADGNNIAEIEGYAIRFSDGSKRDLDNEYFTKNTFLGYTEKVPVFYDHALNGEVKKIPIGYAQLERREDGIYSKGVLTTDVVKDFFSDELEKAQKYLEKIKELGIKGYLGFSTGTAAHTVVKSANGEIKQWILTELSLTPTPAEPLNDANVKSGREFSDKNKTRLKKLREKISELQIQIDEITKDFESVENPSVLDAANKHTFIQYLGQKHNGTK